MSQAIGGRYYHSAVWTGSQMIVWGGTTDGSTELNSGGIYDPLTDSWAAISSVNAPSARFQHTAVWTGSKMIIWGGRVNSSVDVLGDGGIYDPVTDTWTPIATTNAPSARYLHTAIWTGSKMIVWGGWSPSCFYLGVNNCGDGGIYDPSSDTWASLGGALYSPVQRSSHTAVWTGAKMIIWGGSGGSENVTLGTGSIYDPIENAWTAMSAFGAPLARTDHTAVWTGSQMIIWGGSSGDNALLDDGGAYDPSTDSWTPLSTTAAPPARYLQTATWTGTGMIIWGGLSINPLIELGDGGFYFPEF